MARINLDIQATHCYACGVPLVVLPSQRVACPRGHLPLMRTNRNTREFIQQLGNSRPGEHRGTDPLAHAAGFPKSGRPTSQ